MGRALVGKLMWNFKTGADTVSDSDLEEVQAQLDGYLARWVPRLGLDAWELNIRFSRGEGDKDQYASCEAYWEYLMATITFYGIACVSASPAMLEEVVIHECCHCLVVEMRQDAEPYRTDTSQSESEKHEERVVTQLTKAFLRTYDAGRTATTKKR